MPIYQSKLYAFSGDARDYIFSSTLSTLPSKVDWRGYVLDVENQFQFNSCTANSVVGACEMILQANDQFINLSRMFNYYESRIHGAVFPADGGAYVRDAIAGAYKVGLPKEEFWPYVEEKLNLTPTQPIYDNALLHRIDRYERIFDGFDYTYNPNVGGTSTAPNSNSTIGSSQWINDIKSAVSEGFPVVIGLPLTQKFEDIIGNFESQSKTPYTGVSTENPNIGGHAVVVVGYDDTYDSFIILNSWGSGWGYGGFALIPYSTSHDFNEAWVIKGFMGMTINTSAFINEFTPPINSKYDIPFISFLPTYPIYYSGVYAMAVTSTDLVWRKSTSVSTTPASNGGLINLSAAVTTNVKNNLFPDVSQVERTSGSVTYRKVFLHVNKLSQDELLNARISLGGVTPAQDFVVFYTGTKNDTEATMNAARPYGAGLLAASVLAGATSLSVTPENVAWYTTNTPIRVSDLVSISDGTNTNYVTVSAVTYGATIEITCTATINAFASNAFVASVYSVASTKANYAAPVVTSVGGSFNSDTNLVVNARGTVDQVWTLTFSNSTSYTVSGDTLGTLGVGTTTSDTTITNPSISAPYFVVKGTGFSGTFAAGNTIVFSTSSATVPLWLSRVVPAGTADVSNNFCSLAVTGESY